MTICTGRKGKSIVSESLILSREGLRDNPRIDVRRGGGLFIHTKKIMTCRKLGVSLGRVELKGLVSAPK